MRRLRFRIAIVSGIAIAASFTTFFVASTSSSATAPFFFQRHGVLIPATDKFVPYHITVHIGDRVTWINNDTDDHTIVSDDAFNAAGHQGLNHLIPGTDSNNGQPGVFSLRFLRLGTFVYYRRFHAHLDEDSQPVAPGPDGGIQDANGNFGTPMNGIVSVVP